MKTGATRHATGKSAVHKKKSQLGLSTRLIVEEGSTNRIIFYFYYFYFIFILFRGISFLPCPVACIGSISCTNPTNSCSIL